MIKTAYVLARKLSDGRIVVMVQNTREALIQHAMASDELFPHGNADRAVMFIAKNTTLEHIMDRVNAYFNEA